MKLGLLKMDMIYRVKLYTGKSKICCGAKLVFGGTPFGLVLSTIIFNLPLALLIVFNVINFDFRKKNGEIVIDLLKL
jgi:hypothetical protein